LKAELLSIEKQTLQSKLELEAWRKEAKILEDMLKKPNANTELISDILSEVNSRKSMFEEVIFILTRIE